MNRPVYTTRGPGDSGGSDSDSDSGGVAGDIIGGMLDTFSDVLGGDSSSSDSGDSDDE